MPFTKKSFNEYFDLKNENIEDISVYRSNSGDTCYIAKKGDRTFFYSGFILYSGPHVSFICDIGFQSSSKSGMYIPRLTFKKVLNNGEIKTTDREFVIIEFSGSDKGVNEFWKMISFLYAYKELVDVGNFTNQYRVTNTDQYIAEFKTKLEYEKIVQLKEMDLSEEIIKNLLLDTRKDAIEVFKEFLITDNYIETYKSSHNINEQGEEAAWHHFLKNNDWILGLNIDIKFIREFTSEVNLGIQNTGGVGSPKLDLMGISDYTTLVELKTSNTKFFTDKKRNTGRANTWSFSTDFIDGISQCLGQKFDWDKCHKNKDLINGSEILSQDKHRTVDPKTIFIIGNKEKELSINSRDGDVIIKRETLERFRRNNRNIEILSFDELYERAYFIVYNSKPDELDYLNRPDNKNMPF